MGLREQVEQPYTLAQHGSAWLSMAQHGSAWLSMAQHGSAWLSMAQHDAWLRPAFQSSSFCIQSMGLCCLGSWTSVAVELSRCQNPRQPAYYLMVCRIFLGEPPNIRLFFWLVDTTCFSPFKQPLKFWGKASPAIPDTAIVCHISFRDGSSVASKLWCKAC